MESGFVLTVLIHPRYNFNTSRCNPDKRAIFNVLGTESTSDFEIGSESQKSEDTKFHFATLTELRHLKMSQFCLSFSDKHFLCISSNRELLDRKLNSSQCNIQSIQAI